MNRIIFILVAMLATYTSGFGQNKTILTGKITDKKTGLELRGVSVYFPDLKTGAITDTAGYYQIDNLPKSRALVEVSFNGYKVITEQVDLSNTTSKDFEMQKSVTELSEVVITGLSKATERNRTPSPISIISQVKLREMSSMNIIDAIAKQPGISQITTGPGISKPVIRGLGYNRIVVINNGIRQEGQQWGDEHGIEIDENEVNRVEILKGPASLAYGSDALAGVINFLPAPTLPEGSIKGAFLANYQTNNGLLGGSLNMGGNQNGFIWGIRYSNRMAHSYKNKYDGYVFNSGFRENNLNGLVGINKSWGYMHLNFSMYNLTPGIVEGERDSLTGKFLKPIAENDSTDGEAIATKSDFKSYKPLVPYQKIHHYKIALNSNFIIGEGSLKATLGWQQNRRQEYDDVLKPKNYALYFYMNTINYDIHYNISLKHNIDLSFGVNGIYQNSQNRGEEFLIPDYNLFDFGVFAMAKKTWNRWTLSGGLRYDLRLEHGQELWLDDDDKKTTPNAPNAKELFKGFNQKYPGFSGSLGATYQFNENLFTKFNVSKGFRAPNIAEISANGVHEGSVQYIIGSPLLKSEESFQFDYAIGLHSKHVSVEADIFYNYIKNYIFLEKMSNMAGQDSITDKYKTFKYTSGNAHVYGGEISIDIHPHPWDWLHFENSFSFVQSMQLNQPDSMKYLPFTPAPKLHSELRASAKKLGKFLANSFIKIEVDNYFKQNNFYKAFGTETATNGYTLLGVGIGTDVVCKERTLFSLFVSANNLTDVAYQSHLSRLKHLGTNNLTGREGVFNMGRNISFKLIVPIDIR